MFFSTEQRCLSLNVLVSTGQISPFGGYDGVYDPRLWMGSVRTFAFDFQISGMVNANGGPVDLHKNGGFFLTLNGVFGKGGFAKSDAPNFSKSLPIGSSAPTGDGNVGQVTGASKQSVSEKHVSAELGGGDLPVENTQPSQYVHYAICATAPDDAAARGPAVGQVTAFAAQNLNADGWLFADGSVLKIADYLDLFEAIGATYGGDGITTFGLPDLRGAAVIGAGTSEHGVSFELGQKAVPEATAVGSEHLPDPTGDGQPLNNIQESIALNYIIRIDGSFPSEYAIDDAEPVLGEIVAFAGDTPPDGYVFAHGQSVNVTDNPELFTLLGFRFGGDYRSVFHLPDLRGVSIMNSSPEHPFGTEFGFNEIILDAETFDADLVLTGTGSQDTLVGLLGSDDIKGRAGNDLIMGAGGDDILNGGNGADTIDPGAGTDVMTGGNGEDVFVIGRGRSWNRITDFEAGIDRLDLSKISAGDFARLPHWTALTAMTSTIRLNDRSSLSFSNLSGDATAGSASITSSTGDKELLIAQVETPWQAIGAGPVQYQWLRNGHAIDGADESEYRLTTSDSNAEISLRVTYVNGAGHLVTLSSNVISTSAQDVLAVLGSGASDDLKGTDAHEKIKLGAGGDNIEAGRGNDVINAGSGSDTVAGGSGQDIIKGGHGSDALSGGLGRDALKGGRGGDTVDGGKGRDTIDAGGGDDSVRGGQGADAIYGGQGNDVVEGGRGDDTITGGQGDDTLRGGRGNDILIFSEGHNDYQGGNGFDTLLLTDAKQGVDVNLMARTVEYTYSTWHHGRETRHFDESEVHGIEQVIGSAYDDTMTGDSGDNILIGGQGADFISSFGGNNLLEGEEGRDTLQAGVGRDTLRGGAGNDVLSANSGHSTLHGGQGADKLIGVSEGDSEMYGGTGADVFVFKPMRTFGTGHHVVKDFDIDADKIIVNLSDPTDRHNLRVLSLEDSVALKYNMFGARGMGDLEITIEGVSYFELAIGVDTLEII